MAHFVVSEPGRVAVAVPVHDGLSIGRQEGNDIVLGDVNVSRRHAAVRAAGDGFELVDLGSTHGVFVNGQRVEGARRLAAGDEVRLAGVGLVFVDGDPGEGVVQRRTTGPFELDAGADARRLRLLCELAAAIGGDADPDELLGRMLEAVIDAVDCERAVAGLLEDGSPGLRRITRARPGAGGEVIVSRALLEAVLTRQESLLVHAGGGPGAGAGSLVRERVRTAIAVPLAAAGRLFGFLYLDDRRRDLEPEDLEYAVAVAPLVAALLESDARRARAEADAAELRATLAPHEILGASPPMRELLARLDKLGPAGDAHVLVRGESGTGKELVARTLHARSPRRAGPWVAVNCAAMPDTLVEAELFGHERGAFTGATRAKRGRFALADRGTLFLDEIGDLSLSAQAKVLRAIEAGEILPLGSERAVHVDVRVISATHKDLGAEVRAGRFREDLYYRLAVFEVTIPPLRERGDDVRDLAHEFLAEIAPRMGKRLAGFSELAVDCLRRYPWPGNVRELRNEVERAAILAEGQLVGVADLSPRVAAPPPAPEGAERTLTLAERFALLETTERELVEAAFAAAKGNLSEAARLLGISRIMMRRRVERFGAEK
jgi:Nif-specific regulatory protein